MWSERCMSLDCSRRGRNRLHLRKQDLDQGPDLDSCSVVPGDIVDQQGSRCSSVVTPCHRPDTHTHIHYHSCLYKKKKSWNEQIKLVIALLQQSHQSNAANTSNDCVWQVKKSAVINVYPTLASLIFSLVMWSCKGSVSIPAGLDTVWICNNQYRLNKNNKTKSIKNSFCRIGCWSPTFTHWRSICSACLLLL